MRQKVFLGLLILLVALGIFSVVYAVVNPERNIINYISGSATVVIAILTMAYVYITSRQLDVMGKQLEQIEIERRVQNQPLPYINNIDVRVEKPEFYFAPPNREYSVLSRYWVGIKIRNIGKHPAVCIHACARMEVGTGNRKRFLLAASVNIPTLAEKEDYPDSGGGREEFLFAGDKEGEVIQALRDDHISKLPLLECRILFRNVMGGCFMSRCRYRIYMEKEEDDSAFSSWLTEIQKLWIKHKYEVDKLRAVRESDREKWHEGFDRLRESFSASVSGDDMKIIAWPIPGSFVVKAVGVAEYEKEVAGLEYGVRVKGLLADKCVAEDEGGKD